jgi:hypothetical protein
LLFDAIQVMIKTIIPYSVAFYGFAMAKGEARVAHFWLSGDE